MHYSVDVKVVFSSTQISMKLNDYNATPNHDYNATPNHGNDP
jgi:hypothetical protein